ncbi:nuclease-related domain-containing protein [Aquibacillus sediminis]|uniref:nuclease-related domain-containing protein n=1 Tax=Aquibacillus sediminis TaxID=2574734 RepID=UPI0011087EB2|nr:nuclease-related domain-containing protein [Aquibacillus sediminis]
MEPRQKPLELVTLELLSHRMALPLNEQQRLTKLEKGYQGEKKFDGMIEILKNDAIVLNDLWFEINNTKFQIDSLVILQNMIYPFEVKNYEGDFYVEVDRWFTMSKREISSPQQQVNRSTILLRQLLQQHGLHFQIQPYLVFVNDAFTLYQAPKDPTIIFPTQLNRFLEKLHNEPSALGARHKKLAEKLVELRTSEQPRAYEYTYDQLEKGIVCAECGGLLVRFNLKKLACNKCNHEVHVETAVRSNIDELQILFPDKKLTVASVYDWCGGYVSQRTINEVLRKNFRLIYKGRASYYIKQ